MISLAPFKYRNILNNNGGPIEKVECSSCIIANEQLGHEAIAYLDSKLNIKKSESFFLYSNADGSGSSLSRSEAIYKAISESLERWAFYQTVLSNEKVKYGFDRDPSTNGMAAFPGLFKSQSRHLAYCEALERNSLVSWWSARQPLVKHNLNKPFTVFEIISGDPFAKVALLTREINDKFIYGFAAAKTLNEAINKAEIELERNAFVLSLPIDEKIKEKMPLFEKRLLFFSEGKGKKLFDMRVAESLNCKIKPKAPELCIDTEIKGPWSKYATVWRCLFATDIDISNDRLDFFLF